MFRPPIGLMITLDLNNIINKLKSRLSDIELIDNHKKFLLDESRVCEIRDQINF